MLKKLPVIDELTNARGACAILGGIHRATLRRGIREGRFPPPIKVGGNTNRWSTAELYATLERLAAERPVYHRKTRQELREARAGM